jgi:uncharacterized protein (DUF2141 family)
MFRKYLVAFVLFNLSLRIFAASTSTAEIIILVAGVPSDNGKIACALFTTENGFPLDTSEAVVHSQAARQGEAECRYEGLSSRSYAVAVFHDENDNGGIDLNGFGIPTEAWGVSNNIRPRMRAPRFEEASFKLVDGETLQLEVRVR